MRRYFYELVEKETARKGQNKACARWLETLGWNTNTLETVYGTKCCPRVACATVNKPSLLLRVMAEILSLFE